jgi:hypothetical protein
VLDPNGQSGDGWIRELRERGLQARLLGKASFDRAQGRFLRFELLAVGTRWGGRSTDMKPSPIGFFFTIAGTGPAERLPPAQFWKYGWNR